MAGGLGSNSSHQLSWFYTNILTAWDLGDLERAAVFLLSCTSFNQRFGPWTLNVASYHTTWATWYMYFALYEFRQLKKWCPISVVHMYTLAIAVGALIALVLPVRAGSGINWQCGTPDCDDSTITFECDSPGSPRLSIEGQCPNRPNDVLNCQFLYDLVGDLGPIGKCHGPCTPNCPLQLMGTHFWLWQDYWMTQCAH